MNTKETWDTAGRVTNEPREERMYKLVSVNSYAPFQVLGAHLLVQPSFTAYPRWARHCSRPNESLS